MTGTGKRSAVVCSATLFFLTLIATAFWLQDWQYSLPAPKPAGLRQPAIGSLVALRNAGLDLPSNQPVFLHFFNPDCPCSRFNIEHVRTLIRTYGKKVRFVAVLQGDAPSQDLLQSFNKLSLGIEAAIDERGAASGAAGVYATPQAVLLDAQGRLYYRGNYNSSRYCTVRESEYARIALESMLAGKSPPQAPPQATIAYGCPLPKRKKAAGTS